MAEREVFPKTINERILRQWQQTVQCFFTRTNGGKMETTFRQTRCPVSKILQQYIKELKLTVLLVWQNKLFQHSEFVFTFSESLCYMLLFSYVNKNFLFWRLSNDWMNWQKERFCQKQLTSESFDSDNKQCSFFSQGQTEERWKWPLDRHGVRFPKFSKILQWRICFYFLGKHLLYAIVFVRQ